MFTTLESDRPGAKQFFYLSFLESQKSRRFAEREEN